MSQHKYTNINTLRMHFYYADVVPINKEQYYWVEMQ